MLAPRTVIVASHAVSGVSTTRSCHMKFIRLSSIKGWCILLTALFAACAGKFDPYVDNGGTVVCVAGKDYCIIAADTRLSDQYMIRSRRISRIFEVDDGLVFTGSGCWADVVALSKDLQSHATTYEWEHRKKLSIRPLSYLLSSQLYSKRFFPYYTFCSVAGIDNQGTDYYTVLFATLL
jgi:20S proteasome alpha/beta subunit